MPRSNVTGGKHHKKGKKHKGPVNVKLDNAIEYAGVDQVYGLVKKKDGGSRLHVECSDGKERSARIPGKFFKKVWMNVGDIVLCDLNVGGDDAICAINKKYTHKDANLLKSQGKISFEVAEEKEEMGGFKYATDSKDSNTEGKNRNNVNVIGDSDSENDSNENDRNVKNDDIFEVKNPNRKNIIISKQHKNNKNDDFDDSDDSDQDDSSGSIDLKKL